MRKVYLLIIILITLILYKINSFYIAILRNGFNPTNIKILKTGTNINKTEFKIVLIKSKNNPVLVMMEKNKFGLWEVMYTSPDMKCLNNKKEVTNQPIGICWFTPGLKLENNKSEPIILTNYLYYGNNAIKSIKFLPNQIPKNIDIYVEQEGNEYVIYATTKETIDFDIRSILLQLKFIN